MTEGTVCQRSHCRGAKRNAVPNLNTQLIALSFAVLLGAMSLLVQWLSHLLLFPQQCLYLLLFLHQATLKQSVCIDMNRKNKSSNLSQEVILQIKSGVLNVSVFYCVTRRIPCKVFHLTGSERVHTYLSFLWKYQLQRRPLFLLEHYFFFTLFQKIVVLSCFMIEYLLLDREKVYLPLFLPYIHDIQENKEK